MPVPPDLQYFMPSEFAHPELVLEEAVRFLEAVRAIYGSPLIITSDARTPEENAAASGSSPTSWHLAGRAFDLRYPASPEAVWRFVKSVVVVAAHKPVELELVNNPAGVIRAKDCTAALVGRIRAAPTAAAALTVLQNAIRRDQHTHLAVLPPGHQSRIVVAAD
jgi:peptidase M15-like protein